MGKIVVIGSSNTDMIMKVSKMPKPGETVLGGVFSTAPGGKGANQAVAAARSGGDVTFIAKLGDDAIGRQAHKGLMDEGIDVSLVKFDQVNPTGVAMIFVDQKGENSIGVASGANATLSKEDVDAGMLDIETADLLLLQLETPLAVIEHAVKLGAMAGVKVVLNPAPAAVLPESIYDGLYCITPNQTETQILTGVAVNDVDSAQRAADILLAKGVEHVIITMGSQGAFWAHADGSLLIPAFSVTPVDTTAAGDVFNGTLAVAVAGGSNIEHAIYRGNAAAAISVTRHGAQPSAPNAGEIEEFLSAKPIA